MENLQLVMKILTVIERMKKILLIKKIQSFTIGNRLKKIIMKFQHCESGVQMLQHTHLDTLLGILRKRLLPELPKSSKTFLKTTFATYEIEEFVNGDGEVSRQFVYFGIANHLRRCVNTHLHKENTLYLQFNVDGVSLFKSSSQQLWPILCKLHFEPNIYETFPVAIYAGTEKPNNVDKYFEKFIIEILNLLRESITINDRLFEIRIKCFICDRPARSFAKCIKNHGGYYACERCTVPGEREI